MNKSLPHHRSVGLIVSGFCLAVMLAVAGIVVAGDRGGLATSLAAQSGVALNPDGTIKTVAVMDLKAEKPQEMATEQFLGQFTNKSSRTLRYGEDINAVSGATESSRTVLIAVKVVVAVFLKYIKGPI